MSANNAVYIKKNKKWWEVYYQSNADEEGLGDLEKKFKTLNTLSLENACRYAEKLCREYMVEYGVRFIFEEK